MQVYEIRNLMNGKLKKIDASPELLVCFNEYKKLISKIQNECSEFELFYAGYILSNPIVRQQLLKDYKHEQAQESKYNK